MTVLKFICKSRLIDGSITCFPSLGVLIILLIPNICSLSHCAMMRLHAFPKIIVGDFFPSAAFAWNVAEEGFLKDNNFFSSMKLRLGWGKTGQQDIGMDRCYAYQAKYIESSALTTQIPWGNGYIYTLAPNAYNPNIKWETTETYNVGLDFGIFGGRINGNIDAYLRKHMIC